MPPQTPVKQATSTTMNTLEITLQRKVEGRWAVVAERSAAGSALPMRIEGALELDDDALQVALHDARGYGELLGQGLFRDAVRDAFAQARAEDGSTLRVLLAVEDPALRLLRWERLCAPFEGGWQFLALNQRAPLSLYLPSMTDRRFPPIGRRDLRALVLVANVEGLEKFGLSAFDGEASVRGVRGALGEIPCDVLAVGEAAVGPPTLDALCERITAQSYSLLHVVCHGRFHAESGDTILYLARAGGGVEPVKATTLIERLGRLQGARGLPHFAFLCTCESAMAEAEGALGGLGQRLVRELGMPAVIAMTEKISVVSAEALASAFYRQFRQHGEVDRALVEATAGMQGRFDVTVPALFSRLGGRPLFSDTLDREITPEEIKFGLAQCEVLVTQRAPVLVRRFDEIAGTLRAAAQGAREALSAERREESATALREVDQLCEEVAEIRFAALAQGQAPAPYDGRCPFRGLYPFKADDREFFCGREQLIERLAGRLAGHPMLAVLGPSGSGKSSVVMAGLVPRLQAARPDLAVGYLTPTADPLGQLDTALAKLPERDALLLVDQFEELFTLCVDAGRRKDFIARLLTLPDRMQVIITLRADFWGECASHPALKDAMLAHQELIGPMDSVELRRGMEEQARKVGLRFEAELCNTILDDVQGEPGAMPLLQHALLELWKRRHGRWLRTQEYRAIGGEQIQAGGVRGAIARTADELFVKLSRADQDMVREIFLRLTQLDENAAPGAGQRDTRRRVRLEELVSTDDAGESAQRCVNQLADARLVVTSRNTVSGEAEVEVAHEALIRYWPRLRAWLDEDRVTLRLREGIGDAAAEWRQRPGDRDLLVHAGARLEEIEKLLVQGRLRLNDGERQYVIACQGQRRARERRRMAFTTGLASLATLALIAASVAGWQANRARHTIDTARGFTDSLMFRFLDQLDDVEHSAALRKELVREVGVLHAALSEVGAGEDPNTAFWRQVLDGDIELEMNQPERARALYTASQTLAQGLQADPNWRRNLSISYGRLAELAQRHSPDAAGLETARALHQRALEIDNALVREMPDNTHWQRDLSISYARLGDLEVQAGRKEAARQHYEESRRIAEALARGADEVEARRDLAYSHIRLGHWAYKFDELTRAREHYARAVEIGDGLADSELDNDQWQHSLMTSHKRLGELTLQDDQRLDAARKSSRRALALALKLAERGGDDWGAQFGLFRAYTQLVDVEIASREYGAAGEVLAKALPLGEDMTRLKSITPTQRDQIRRELVLLRATAAHLERRDAVD